MVLPRKLPRPDRTRGLSFGGPSGEAPPKTPAEIRARAVALLARREHSRVELRRKLSHAGVDTDVVETVLDALEEEKLLSDQRFAEGVGRVRGARYGSRRVAQDLHRTGVGVEAEAVLDHLKASDLERAREVWARKFGAAPADVKERARQMRFLLARGFPTGVIYQVVPRAGRGEDDA